MLSFVRDLLAHSEWANAVFFHAWGQSAVRDRDEMRERMWHVLFVQEAFLGVLEGHAFEPPPEGPPPSFDELRARFASSHRRLLDLTAGLGEAGLARTVHIPWFPDPPCVIPVGEALIQVALHNQHHRGQCITRLRDWGGEPKNVDWIIWLWKQKPAGRWG